MSRDAGPQMRGIKRWYENCTIDGAWSNYQFRHGYRRSLRSDYKGNPYKKIDYLGDLGYNYEFAHKWERRVHKKKILQKILQDLNEGGE